jgi:hypothetical protein
MLKSSFPPNLKTSLQIISTQAYQPLLSLQLNDSPDSIKIMKQLKRTINLCQRAIAQERRNAYQSRRLAMQRRRAI